MADQYRRKALLGELGIDDEAPEDLFDPSQRSPNTGIGGVPDVTTLDGPAFAPSEPATPMASALAAPDYSRLNGGFNMDKVTNASNKSYDHAKSAMARALAGFDPTKGFGADSVAALNALGYGNFSAQDGSDKLSLSGLTDKGRQAGLVGDYKDADFIEALKSGNGRWGYQDPAYEAANPEEVQVELPQGGGGLVPFGGISLGDDLSGDPIAKIKAAIAALSGSKPNQAALLQQLGGGR